MKELTRRSYLKAVAAGGATVASATGFAIQAQANTSIPENKQKTCQKGTTFTAEYDAENCNDGFTFIDGDNVINFPSFDCNSNDQIVAFDWEIESGSVPGFPIATVTVREGNEFSEFEGVFSGSVRVDDPIEYVTFCGPGAGRAAIGERDLNGYSVDMHFDGDPVLAGHDDAVHVTSGTTETSDYSISQVKVLNRIGSKTVTGISSLDFEYFEGTSNTGAAPDEIFLGLLDEDNDTVFVAVTSIDKGDAASWRTLDVESKLSESRWKVNELTYSDLTSGFVHDEGEALRDNPDSSSVSLKDSYGTTTILSVGIGVGNTRAETIQDRYYDNLNVDSSTVGFPAVIPMTLAFTEPNSTTIRATMDFQQTENVVSIDEVNLPSIELNAFQEITPPIERGLIPKDERITSTVDPHLEADFEKNLVEDIINGSRGDQAIVSGDFKNDSGTKGSSFYGVGTPL